MNIELENLKAWLTANPPLQDPPVSHVHHVHNSPLK